jgi:hypothetical protein
MNQEQGVPQGFVLDVFQKEFHFPDEAISSIWEKLQRRETFTKGQLFPYRVEFAANSQEGVFSPGELNIHHGPFLSLSGAIGEVSSTYRNLHYFYGSYVISFRIIRPVQLEFFRNGPTLTLKLHTFIRPWLRPFWRFSNQFFWSIFGLSIR